MPLSNIKAAVDLSLFRKRKFKGVFFLFLNQAQILKINFLNLKQFKKILKNLKFFLAPIEIITWVFIGPVQIMLY